MRLLMLLLCFACCLPAAARANPQLDAAKTCLADNTSGRDRKALGRWIFLAIAAHPEVSVLSSATPEDREKSDREFAALVMRLLTEDCVAEFRALTGGDPRATEDSFKAAFEFLGGVAMQELMTNKEAGAAISGYARFLDEDRMREAFGTP